MSLNHEHRGRPLVAAYHDPEDPAPEKPLHRAVTPWWRPSWATGAARSLREWVAAEWRLLTIYLAAALFAFVGVAVSQNYWPNETLAVWGTVWRPALICTGAVTFVLLVFEWSVRGMERDR